MTYRHGRLVRMKILIKRQCYLKLTRHEANKILGVIFMFFASSCFAKPIVIPRVTVIDRPTKYDGVILDLTKGSFLVTNNATLQIENSTINGTISPDNPFLINVVNGQIYLKNTKVHVNALNIIPDPIQPSIYYVINVAKGMVTLLKNQFDINEAYTAGLLTTGRFSTSHFDISFNKIRNFHGGVLLKYSNQALVSYNRFLNVSISNVFMLGGKGNVIKNNTILFPGNNNVGDGIDVIDSDNISLLRNYIALGSCYSVVILRGTDVYIDHNMITGGITYALYITPSIGFKDDYNKFLWSLIEKNVKLTDLYANKNIQITNNYLAQNRYGLSAKNVDGLIVKNNIFIQRFSSGSNRKFWTNNDVLLQDNVNVNWVNNLYKEAFTQEPKGNNGHSSRFTAFPSRNGVVLGKNHT